MKTTNQSVTQNDTNLINESHEQNSMKFYEQKTSLSRVYNELQNSRNSNSSSPIIPSTSFPRPTIPLSSSFLSTPSQTKNSRKNTRNSLHSTSVNNSSSTSINTSAFETPNNSVSIPINESFQVDEAEVLPPPIDDVEDYSTFSFKMFLPEFNGVYVAGREGLSTDQRKNDKNSDKNTAINAAENFAKYYSSVKNNVLR